MTGAADAGTPLKILVADDDGFVRDLLGAILSTQRHEVELAESGVAAIEKLAAVGDFDLVISDMNMPGMSGLELIRQVRRSNREIPIIILTGNQEISLAIDALKSGANDYLLKNEDIADTVGISVDNVMEKHRLRRENLRLVEELRRSEQSLQEKVRELEQLNRVKNEFVGVAAHDLRSPLAIIEMYAAYLAERTAGRLDGKEELFLEVIQKTSHFMLQLINDLLDLAKIESGTLELALAETEYLDFARNNVSLNAALAARKGITISCEGGTPLRLAFDQGKIDQVLNNFIGNAVKFSPPGSHVTVRVECDSGQIVTRVADEGPGIPAEELPLIFKEFHRGSVQPTAGEKSTGLGLAIVRKIVERHGGTVSVESEVGKGSVFSFSLPLSP